MKRKTSAETFPDVAADVGYNSRYLWSKIDQSAGPQGCWIWTGARHSQGYGMVGGYRLATGKRIMQTVHRLMLKIQGGAIPPGADVIRTCQNMSCVNPAHLQFGSARDIHTIRKSHGRTSSGKPIGWRALGPRRQEYTHGLTNIVDYYHDRIDEREFAIRAKITLRQARSVCKEIKSGKLYKWLPLQKAENE